MIVRIFYSVRFAVAHTIFLLYTLKDIWNPHIVDGGEYILQKTIGIDLGGTNMSVGIVAGKLWKSSAGLPVPPMRASVFRCRRRYVFLCRGGCRFLRTVTRQLLLHRRRQPRQSRIPGPASFSMPAIWDGITSVLSWRSQSGSKKPVYVAGGADCAEPGRKHLRALPAAATPSWSLWVRASAAVCIDHGKIFRGGDGRGCEELSGHMVLVGRAAVYLRRLWVL